MRTFALLLFALCALSSAHARDLPNVGSTAMVGGFDTPVHMELSKAFLERAAAEQEVAAHKLPYSNPFTGMCQPNEMKVSISGIPGRALCFAPSLEDLNFSSAPRSTLSVSPHCPLIPHPIHPVAQARSAWHSPR